MDPTSWDSGLTMFLDGFTGRLSPMQSYSGINEQLSLVGADSSRSVEVSNSALDSNLENMSTIDEPSHVNLGETSPGIGFGSLTALSSAAETTVLDVMHFSPPMRTLSPRPDDELLLINHYKRHLSSFFSVKSSDSTSWNFYTYALMSTEGLSDSPLRHSILAWTSAHLILQNRTSSGETLDALYHHYARARSAVNELLKELAREAEYPMSPQVTSKKLNTVLSTSLFLSFCDIVSDDTEALADGLAKVKTLLVSQWRRLRESLGPLESRVLVWLAYLDLRSNFWTTIHPLLPSSTSGVARQGHVCERGELFNFIMNQKGFSSLRSMRGGRYYLTECFGSSYPEDELRDDLLQEPAKLLSDDVLSILSRILEFETWDDGIMTRFSDHESLIQELKEAKLQAIRADIARVRVVGCFFFSIYCKLFDHNR